MQPQPRGDGPRSRPNDSNERAGSLGWARPAVPSALLLALAACGSEDDRTCVEKGTCRLELTAGDDQAGTVATRLRERLAIRVLDENLLPAAGVEVAWRVVAGGGLIEPERSTTDADGAAAVDATLGTTARMEQLFEASLVGLPSQIVQFSATGGPARAEALTLVSGDDQQGVVGEPLPEPLRVQVTDRFGNGVPQFTVTFQTQSVGARVEPAQPATDPDGFAQVTGILGGMPFAMPADVFTARAEGVMGNAVVFSVTSRAGPPASITRLSGDMQAGIPGQTLAQPIVVRVTDRFGNVVRGSTVTFTVREGDGATIDPPSQVTDDAGRAQARPTLGPVPGNYRFDAVLDMVTGSPLTFSAIAFPPICSEDRWCWQSPLPQGNTVYGAFTASATSVWVVGENGTILRWNGAAWESLPSGVFSNLRAVHGGDATTVFAVGDAGTVVRWNGTRWEAVTGVAEVNLTSVWLAGRTDGWIGGELGTLVRFDGTRWTPAMSPTMERINGIHGYAANGVWAVGERGTVLRFDGTGWATVPFEFPSVDLNGVWARAENDVWIVGDGDRIFRWNGTQFDSFDAASNQILRGIWGRNANEIYAFGDAGRIRRWDGRRFAPESVRTVNQLFAMTDVGDQLLAVGEGGVFVRRMETAWELETNRRIRTLQAMWGAAPDRAWVVGLSGTILEWNGRSFAETEGVIRADLFAVTGTSASDVWAVGDAGFIVRYDGTRWSSVPSASTERLFSVWPLSGNLAFAVGGRGTIIRWDGTSWRSMPSGVQDDLYGVYGARPDEVWAVGGTGRILRFDGTAWTPLETSPTDAFLLGIRGTARNDVWAWGTSGTILRYDGVEWTRVDLGVTATIFAMWVFDRENAVAVGDDGLILVLSDGRWRVEQSGTANQILGVWGATSSDVWAIGERATILRKRP